jgi:hypothetical protein
VEFHRGVTGVDNPVSAGKKGPVGSGFQALICRKSLLPHGHSAIPIGLGDPSTSSFAGKTLPQELHSAMHRDSISVFCIPTQYRDARMMVVAKMLRDNTNPRNKRDFCRNVQC